MSGNVDLGIHYELLEKVGGGAFGEVYKCVDLRSNEVLAVKIIDLETAGDEIEDVQQEIHVLSQCACEQLTKYMGSFIYGTKLWIIMEFLAGGSVLDLMRAGPLDEAFIAIILRELLKVRPSICCSLAMALTDAVMLSALGRAWRTYTQRRRSTATSRRPMCC